MANSIGLIKQEKGLEDIPFKVSYKEEVDIKYEPLDVNEDEHATEKVEEIQDGMNDMDEEGVEDISREVNDNDDEEVDEIPSEVSEEDADEESIDNNHDQQSKPTESHHACHICKKTFASLVAMKQHIRNHIGDSPRVQENGMSEEMANLMAKATKDQQSAMAFLFDVGCLHSTPPNGCDVEGCDTPMKCTRIDGKHLWKCYVHRKKKSLRYGSILESTVIPLNRWLKIAFIWACDIDINTAAKSILHNKTTIFHWRDFFRTICSRHFARNPIRIGGREEVVQIDTFVYKTRNRTKKGGMNIKKYFVGYCPATPEGFIFVVPDFEEETLIPIIKKHILPGSVIHSDLTPVFKSIPELNVEPAFTHVTFESTDDFVCPVTDEYVNYTELYYKKHEEKYVEKFGVKGEKLEKLQHHLDELMWRDRHGQSQRTSLENLFLHIKELNQL